jgi:hypothetical protein
MQMPNKRESIETLVRAIIDATGLEMIKKISRDRGLSNQTIEALGKRIDERASGP